MTPLNSEWYWELRCRQLNFTCASRVRLMMVRRKELIITWADGFYPFRSRFPIGAYRVRVTRGRHDFGVIIQQNYEEIFKGSPSLI